MSFTFIQSQDKVLRRWKLAIVLLIVVLSGFFDRINVSVLIPNHEFQNAIGVHSPALLGLLMTGFLVAYGFSAIALGFLGDLFLGPRRGLIYLLIIWTLLMAMMGLTGSFYSLLILRILLGITEGPLWPMNSKLVKRWFPLDEQGRANALWNIGSPLGSAIGFPLVIFVISIFGWRESFFTLAAITLFIVLPLVLIFVRDFPDEDPKVTQKELNYIKNSTITENSSMELEELKPSMSVVAKMGVFLSNSRVFLSNSAFWMVTLALGSYMSLLWGMNTWLPTYLQVERHFGTTYTGIFTSLPFFAMFLGELLGAYLADRWMKRAAVCFISLSGAAVALYIVSTVSNAITAALIIIVTMFLLGGAIPSSLALLLQVVPEGLVSAANGVCVGVGNLISSLIPFIMGVLISMTGNFNSGLLFLVCVGIIGSVTMLPFLRRY